MIKFHCVTFVFLAAAAALLPSHSHAKEWPSAGGFDIIEGDQFCGAISEYSFDGRSDVKLSLALTDEDTILLIFSSADWSAKDGEFYPNITYSLNGYTYTDPKDDAGKIVTFTKGSNSDGTNGFLRGFPLEFLDDFAKSDALLIENSDTVITHINLNGSAAAVKILKECVAYVKVKNESNRRKEAQWGYIEKDPFKAANKKLAANRSPAPKGPSVWATTGDYPASALAEKREGTAEFALTVEANGKASACKITKSSGHADLDSVACSTAVRRARLSPATDENANPTIGIYAGRVRWVLPQE
jgi:TonB family protein